MMAVTNGVERYEGDGGHAQYKSDVHLAILFNGEFDMWDLVAKGSLTQPMRQFFGGTPEAVKGRYDEASPVKWLTVDVPPMLFLHGDQDKCVSHAQSVAMVARLSELDVPAEVEIYPGSAARVVQPGPGLAAHDPTRRAVPPHTFRVAVGCESAAVDWATMLDSLLLLACLLPSQEPPVVATHYFYWYRWPTEHFDQPGAPGHEGHTHHFREPERVDYESAGWHQAQFRAMAGCGIDVALPVYWGAPGSLRQEVDPVCPRGAGPDGRSARRDRRER